MINKLKHELIEALIKFDFLFFQSITSNKSNRYFIKSIIPTRLKKHRFIYLEPLELIKSLKQILRLFQFLKNHQHINIIFKFNDECLLDFLKFLVVGHTNTTGSLFYTAPQKMGDIHCAHFFIDIAYTRSFYQTLLEHDQFLIANINTFFQNYDFGSYKVFNNLQDWQKIVFFSLLIRNSLIIKK